MSAPVSSWHQSVPNTATGEVFPPGKLHFGTPHPGKDPGGGVGGGRGGGVGGGGQKESGGRLWEWNRDTFSTSYSNGTIITNPAGKKVSINH